MSFNKEEKAELLKKCHRRCCICHRFCGFKMEMHHIDPKAKSDDDNIENAIPLCFECHAEVGCYNEKHPKGTKYSKTELIGHKKQWLEICEKVPQIFVNAANRDIGSLEGMILELKFNINAAKLADGANPDQRIGCALKSSQYEKAISEGTLLLLPDGVKEKLDEAYLAAGKINTHISMYITPRDTNAFNFAKRELTNALRNSKDIIEDALELLNNFLSQGRKVNKKVHE